MYLRAGIPVVSTWLRECRSHSPLVRVARTAAEFAGAIRDAVANDSPAASAARIALAARSTWDGRARFAVSILSECGLLTPAPADGVGTNGIVRASDAASGNAAFGTPE